PQPADAAPALKQRPAVAPKLTTMWDQLQPYNEQTPFHSGLPCPTGCVATALAQIMNWHRWPLQPVGTKEYVADYVGRLSIDFSRITFDWDKMLDRYYVYSPEENIYAVSTLMKAAGYASEMSYHQRSSGAQGFKAAGALIEHFGYNRSLSLERREWYGIEEWEDLVYAELTENGPVYYEGTGDGGGHAFVCDGYDDATGFFHFNWGWSGSGDGYYRLSALNPDVQGTGGNSAGYNYSQDIIRGLRKSAGADEQPTYQFAAVRGVVTPWESAKLGEMVSIKGYETNDGFANYSVLAAPQVELGARIRCVADGTYRDIPGSTEAQDFGPYTKVLIIRFALPESLAEGSYTIVPIWRMAGGPWQLMREAPRTRNYVPFEVEGTTATFGLGEADGRIEAELTSMPDFFTTRGEFTITGTLAATGTKDFSGLLCAVFVTYDSKGELKIIDQGEAERIDVAAGSSIDWQYTSRPGNARLTDGDDFLIVIGNADTGELVSPIYPIKVGNRYGTLDMTTYNFSIAGSNFLDPTNVSVSVNIKVLAGEYDGPLALGYSLTKEPFAPERYTVSEPVHLTAGDDKQVSFSGVVDDVEAGTLYYTHLMYRGDDGSWIRLSPYPVSVLIANTYSGIGAVSIDASDSAVYYDVYGRPTTAPSPGALYIRIDASGRAAKVAM
ncbi:MAG: C10 family peptidase, partial [Terasakiella sp.]|nr:C10 family peptidase [Terasakiella sp.]